MSESIDEKEIEYLVGNNKIFGDSTILYNSKICEFINEFSNELNNHKSSKNFPDLKTLSFWCRKKNILNFKRKFLSNETRIGLGLIFHITPSNIPTNFAYSLIFGLISGNSNIIKVPSKKFDQVDIICQVISKILKRKKFAFVKKFISVVRYKDNDEYTKKISSICRARLTWGGDSTIKKIRKFDLQPRGIDIAFADRYSFCIINSDKILKMKKHEMQLLVNKFYNDTYLVDQNACSSPHLVIWMGKKIPQARTIFWNKLNNFVNINYDMPEIASLDKYNMLFENFMSSKKIEKFEKYSNSIYTIMLKNLEMNQQLIKGKWGFFYEYKTNNLSKIAKYINNKYQTLTYFGFEKDFLKTFIITNKLSGIDRVVPIGQALSMNLYWDGFDINKTLSRVIDIQ